ncbi:hypothetical protein HF086_011462, partial [Spodoptera exigua]
MPLNTETLLRTICRYVYYAGAGNCWYEDIYHETIPYYTYSVITFSIYTIMIFLENLAALFGNFPGVEKNSAVMFAAIHNIVLTKMFLLLYHKKSIRKLNYEMANVGASYEEDYVMRKQYRKVTVGIWLYVISVYLSLSAYGIESARRSIVEGIFLYIFSHFLIVTARVVLFKNNKTLHRRLYSLADEIHRVFGIIMSLQVCESSAVAVLLLLRLALSPHLDLTNAFMTYTFVSSLFLLLALNLWNAGEITYQASLLSNAMFYCGWHLCDIEKNHDIRKLVIIGCTQAQKPLILKAFGIQDLSYETFVSV